MAVKGRHRQPGQDLPVHPLLQRADPAVVQLEDERRAGARAVHPVDVGLAGPGTESLDNRG